MNMSFFDQQRPHNGMTYYEFMNLFDSRSNDLQSGKAVSEPPREAALLKLNLQRSRRIYQQFRPDPEVAKALADISEKQIWMVLTEDWCGDSAQNLPVITRIAELNPLIDLRILERDENLDIMDLYLTNGSSRSIPKLVAFSHSGEELFQWGPRPVIAQEEFVKRKSAGIEKDENNKLLHTWYARDRGKSVALELAVEIGRTRPVPVQDFG